MSDYDLLADLSKEATQAQVLTALGSILSELNAKLEAGQSISVGNLPDDFPDAAALAKAEAIRLLLAGTLAVTAASLPLPAGAASETTLASVLTALGLGIYDEDSPHTSGDKGKLIFGIRWDSDTPTANDGDYTALKLDEAGRLKVATMPASYPITTGNISAVGGTVVMDVSRVSNVMLHCKPSGSVAGHNSTFEGSLDSTNGTNGTWFTLQAIRSNANTIETATGALAAAPAYAWEMSVNALKWIRVRATAHTSGTMTWMIQPGTYATEPIPGAQISGTQPVSGSVTATLAAAAVRAAFIAAAGIWWDDSSTVLSAAASFTGTSRDLTVTATATAMANSATYAKEFRVSAESDQTGTLWIEVSRDNTNWRRVKSVATAAVTGGGFYAEIVHQPSWRYIRVGFTNGATLQTRFAIGSFAMAA